MAGGGERFKSATPKQFHHLQGKPLYQWTLEKLEDSQLFDEILLVCPKEHIPKSTHPVVMGGSTRQESSYLGLTACKGADIVLIHDSARPFVSTRILKENIEQASLHGAADTCIPSSDTIVQTSDGHTIDHIPNRKHLWRGQTPQTFSYPLIVEAHKKTAKKNATDDCQLVIDLGKKVAIVQGEETNIKITTTQDLQFAEHLLQMLRQD